MTSHTGAGSHRELPRHILRSLAGMSSCTAGVRIPSCFAQGLLVVLHAEVARLVVKYHFTAPTSQPPLPLDFVYSSTQFSDSTENKKQAVRDSCKSTDFIDDPKMERSVMHADTAPIHPSRLYKNPRPEVSSRVPTT